MDDDLIPDVRVQFSEPAPDEREILIKVLREDLDFRPLSTETLRFLVDYCTHAHGRARRCLDEAARWYDAQEAVVPPEPESVDYFARPI